MVKLRGFSPRSPVGMRMRKKELKLDAAEAPRQPLVLETLHVIGDEGPADVDLESRLLHPVLGVVEELSEDVKYGGLVRNHLLEGDGRVLVVAGAIQEHLLQIVVTQVPRWLLASNHDCSGFETH